MTGENRKQTFEMISEINEKRSSFYVLRREHENTRSFIRFQRTLYI